MLKDKYNILSLQLICNGNSYVMCEQHMYSSDWDHILLNKGSGIEEVVSYHQPIYSTECVMKKVW